MRKSTLLAFTILSASSLFLADHAAAREGDTTATPSEKGSAAPGTHGTQHPKGTTSPKGAKGTHQPGGAPEGEGRSTDEIAPPPETPDTTAPATPGTHGGTGTAPRGGTGGTGGSGSGTGGRGR